MANQRLPLAVLISGGGTTLRNLIEHIDRGSLSATIVVVISSNPSAGGLAFAEDAGIPTRVIERADFASTERFSTAIFDEVRSRHADLTAMGGFLKRIQIPADFVNRVVNIHPSLIPAFCGKGFYGLRVHAAALQYGVKISGCTVHFVDNEYDHGPIILQRTVDVREHDSPESLQQRVFAAECEAFPQAIQLFAEGKLRMAGRQVIYTAD